MSEIKESAYTNSVFEQPWWLETVAPGKWGEAVVREDDRVIARLPYVFDHGTIKNPPYTQTMGVWMEPEQREFVRGNSHLHKQKEIIAELISQLPKANNIDLILDHANSYILPYRWHGFHIEPTFSYRIIDLSDEEALKQNMGKTVIKNVKAARKKLTVCTDSDEIETLIELQKMTYARQNRKPPHSEELTRRVMENAFQNHAGRLMVAKDEQGIAHSAAFFLYDENTCYYLLSGQNPDFRSDGSMNLLLTEGIEFAKSVSKSFDFEGSMVEGIENFFRQFGGVQVVNYRVTRKTAVNEFMDAMKPRIKKLIGYKN